MTALTELEEAYLALRNDPRFWSEFRELLAHYVGRPTPVYEARGLAAAVTARARAIDPDAPDVRIILKREDLAHTGAHNTGMTSARLESGGALIDDAKRSFQGEPNARHGSLVEQPTQQGHSVRHSPRWRELRQRISRIGRPVASRLAHLDEAGAQR